MNKKSNNKKNLQVATSPLSIADLPIEEREKVQRLVERLFTLGQEHDELGLELNNVKFYHAEEIQKLKDTNNDIIKKIKKQNQNEIDENNSKIHMAMSLLKLYQNKISSYIENERKYNRNNNELEAKLLRYDSNTKQMEALIESQRTTIQGHDANRAHAAEIMDNLKSKNEKLEKRVLELEKIIAEKG